MDDCRWSIIIHFWNENIPHTVHSDLSVFWASTEPEVLAYYSVGYSDYELDTALLVEECLLQLPFLCPSQIHYCASLSFLFFLALALKVFATPQVGLISPWYPQEQLTHIYIKESTFGNLNLSHICNLPLIPMLVGELPRDPAYLRNTRAAGRFYKLQQNSEYVVTLHANA